MGTGLVSLDAAPLTAGDDVSDLVVLASDSQVAISPLVADNEAPSAELISPASKQTNTGTVEAIEIRFSEPMRFGSVTDPVSVINPSNYTVVTLGADGVAGTSDDVVIDVVSVTSELNSGGVQQGDPNTFILELAETSVPLGDGVYQVILSSNLRDASDNQLNDGQPVVFAFTINSQGPQFDPVGQIVGVEGAGITLLANFSDSGGSTPYLSLIHISEPTRPY